MIVQQKRCNKSRRQACPISQRLRIPLRGIRKLEIFSPPEYDIRLLIPEIKASQFQYFIYFFLNRTGRKKNQIRSLAITLVLCDKISCSNPFHYFSFTWNEIKRKSTFQNGSHPFSAWALMEGPRTRYYSLILQIWTYIQLKISKIFRWMSANSTFSSAFYIKSWYDQWGELLACPQFDHNSHNGVACGIWITDRIVPTSEYFPVENILIRFSTS